MDDLKHDKAKSPPRAKILDYGMLLSVVDGDETLLRLVCGVFLRTYPAVLTEMDDAMAVNDGKALARAAHKLKGSAGFFVTDSIRLLLAGLEQIGIAGDLTGAASRLQDLKTEMQLLEPEWSALAEDESTNQND